GACYITRPEQVCLQLQKNCSPQYFREYISKTGQSGCFLPLYFPGDEPAHGLRIFLCDVYNVNYWLLCICQLAGKPKTGPQYSLCKKRRSLEGYTELQFLWVFGKHRKLYRY